MDMNGQLHTPAAVVPSTSSPIPIAQEACVGPRPGLSVTANNKARTDVESQTS
jgi:hypothetical protein